MYRADGEPTGLSNLWSDTQLGGTTGDRIYVVQTAEKVAARCILMATDPGDLVLDPTCGSGTTAFVAEQWGRRWITIDTSRVALALARARIMGARYPWYLLADSREGQLKEAEVTQTAPRDTPTAGRLRQGFVYRRVPHITLKSIANNTEIDVIWDGWQTILEPLRARLNETLGTAWEEWQIPRALAADAPAAAAEAHSRWWEARIARQKAIDASIAAKADTEYLYDKPYEDPRRVRVAGPFTVESLSPHRVQAVDADDTLFDELTASEGARARSPESGCETPDFAQMILGNLARAGVQGAAKEDRIKFDSVKGWPGEHICAEAAFTEGDAHLRAGIFIGPEYGTVTRADLIAAARECADAGFDILVACAFSFEAHAAIDKLGRVPILKARMNTDLHMPELAATGTGNLFTVFGEPDIRVDEAGPGLVTVTIAGIDMYRGGVVEGFGPEDIAVWFIDTDYNYESFFVRHAYFPGAADPYKALKTTLKAEIDEDAWASLKRTVSRPFPRPAGGKIAVKVINHLGDEVMKVVAV